MTALLLEMFLIWSRAVCELPLVNDGPETHHSRFLIHHFVDVQLWLKNYGHLKSSRPLADKTKVVGKEGVVYMWICWEANVIKCNFCFPFYTLSMQLHSQTSLFENVYELWQVSYSPKYTLQPLFIYIILCIISSIIQREIFAIIIVCDL